MAQLPSWPLWYSVAILRVVLVLGLCFAGLPYIMLPRFPDRGSAGLAGRFLICLFIEQVLAHVLAPLRLYEGLAIAALMLMALLWRLYFGLPEDQRLELDKRVVLSALDFVDRLTGDQRVRAAGRPAAERTVGRVVPRRPIMWPEMAVLALVIACAAWIRYADTFRHVALPYSDAPLGIFWLKNFGPVRSDWHGLQLIYNPDVGNATGVLYPKGLYAFFSFVRKLSFQNPYLVLLALGPLTSVLTVAGVAGFLRWATGSTLAGAIGAMVYGTLPALMPVEPDRYAAFNSQEFAMLAVLPTAWFAFRYLADGTRWYLWAAASGAGIIMFTHLVPTWIVICFVGSAMVAALVMRSTTLARLAGLVGACAATGAVAVLPLAVGYVRYHMKFHSASAEFLAGVGQSAPGVTIPQLPPVGPLLLIVLPALLAPFLVKQGRASVWFGLLSVLGAGVAWIAPSLLAHVPLPGFSSFVSISTRSGEAGAIGLGLAAGLSWFSVEQGLKRVLAYPSAIAGICLAVVAMVWVALPPAAARPPRFATDETVLQILAIDRNFKDGSWAMVDGDAALAAPDPNPLPGHTARRVNLDTLALYRGQYYYPQIFLQQARMGSLGWCMGPDPDHLVRQPENLFLFLDDEQFPEQARLLREWLAQHSQLQFDTVFRGTKLQVLHLLYSPTAKEANDLAWGAQGMSCARILAEPR